MGVALPSYETASPPGWCERFIGLPYERGARGPDLFDCWGAFVLIQSEQFGVDISAHEGVVWDHKDRVSRADTASVIKQNLSQLWDEVEPGTELAGDGIVLRLIGAPLHVGVVAAPGWMLHASEVAGSALERYDGMYWRNRVEGFYRWRRS